MDASENIFHISSSTTVDTIHAILQSTAELLKKRSPDLSFYRAVCRSLLDNVLPRLSTISSTEQRLLAAPFDAIFLDGVPHIAFTELCSALSSLSFDDGAHIVARILLLFVTRGTGGVSRLSRVIAAAEVEQGSLVSALVHLPGRISNILLRSNDGSTKSTTLYHGSSDEENGGVHNVIDEDVYFNTLAIAVCEQADTHDSQRLPIMSALIARMVVIGRAGTVVDVLIARKDLNIAKKILSVVAPQSSVNPLVRALLDHKVKSHRDGRFVRTALSEFVHDSRAARDACIYSIPFTRPLFQRIREASGRLVHAVVSKSTSERILDTSGDDALITAAEMWADREFSIGADMPLQRQVTRVLLCYMRKMANVHEILGSEAEYRNKLMLVVANGVYLRLGESDDRMRRHAMVVGEAASRFVGDSKPLTFDRNGELVEARKKGETNIGDDTSDGDGGDSDFSDIAKSVGVEQEDDKEDSSHEDIPVENKGRNAGGGSICDNSEKSVQNVGEVSEREVKMEYGQRDVASDRRSSRVESGVWPDAVEGVSWQNVDGWSSPELYEVTSSDEELGTKRQRADEDALREKISAPMSIARMLSLFREMNKSDGGSTTVEPDTVSAALRTVTKRVENNVGLAALRSAAWEIWDEVSRLDVNRFPDSFSDALKSERSKALIAMMRVDITNCACDTVRSVVCGDSADVGRRLEALEVIARATRKEWEEEFPCIAESHVNRSKAQIFAEGMVSIFRTLAEGLCDGIAAEFVHLEGNDMNVWAQALAVLGTLAQCGGATLEGKWMRREALEVTMNRVAPLEGDAVIRRAIALVVGGVPDSMGDTEVQEALMGMGTSEVIVLPESVYGDGELSLSGGGIFERCVKWLKEAEEGDADVGVRRFSTIGLRKWAAKLSSTSHGIL